MKKGLSLCLMLIFLMTLSACRLFNPRPEGTFELVYHATDYFNRSTSMYTDLERYDSFIITIDGDNYEEIKTIGENTESKSYLIKWGKNQTFTVQTTGFKTEVKDIIYHYDEKLGYLEQIKKESNDTHVRVFTKSEDTMQHPPLGTYRLIHSEGQYLGVLITEDFFKEGTLNFTEDLISIYYKYDSDKTYESETSYKASMHSIRLNLEDRYEFLLYDSKEKTLTFNFNASLGHSVNAYKLVFKYEN